ncbi:hypothetical protein SISSUDRAFT_650922 [Sistotremastrum suecicum HHB10207 ss-3]|uniref:Uncharacterized protein n=1 Tax=Sistotremastrum suecicum HHB10207 ss-3 TaxID=1314776 RepID=A0A165X4R6_9AGAM|nr:hypothetical protein SISSUDRAFT_650922 [Sistotremastrum suecicum HHB10207 ss-3]
MRLSDDCSYCGNAVLPCEASSQVDLEPSTSTDTLSAIHYPPPTSAVPPYTDTSPPSSEDRVASSPAVDLPPSPPSPPVKTLEARYRNESSSSPCRGTKRSTSSSSSPDFTPSPSKRARYSVGQPLGIERSAHEKSTSRRDEVEEVWVVGSLAKADGETDARGSGLEATEEDSNTDNLKSLGAASGEARSRNKLRMFKLVPDIKNKLGKVKKVLGR